MAKNKYLIDGEERLEEEADKFAFNEMISCDLWKIITESNDLENKSLDISKEYNIPMCFIVRSLAKEGYIKYNSSFYNKYIEKLDD